MSHLRPIDPNNPDRTKPYTEYTAEERVSALTQMEDAHKAAATSKFKTSDETLELAHKLARGTEKEGNVDMPQPTNAKSK